MEIQYDLICTILSDPNFKLDEISSHSINPFTRLIIQMQKYYKMQIKSNDRLNAENNPYNLLIQIPDYAYISKVIRPIYETYMSSIAYPKVVQSGLDMIYYLIGRYFIINTDVNLSLSYFNKIKFKQDFLYLNNYYSFIQNINQDLQKQLYYHDRTIHYFLQNLSELKAINEIPTLLSNKLLILRNSGKIDKISSIIYYLLNFSIRTHNLSRFAIVGLYGIHYYNFLQNYDQCYEFIIFLLKITDARDVQSLLIIECIRINYILDVNFKISEIYNQLSIYGNPYNEELFGMTALKYKNNQFITNVLSNVLLDLFLDKLDLSEDLFNFFLENKYIHYLFEYLCFKIIHTKSDKMIYFLKKLIGSLDIFPDILQSNKNETIDFCENAFKTCLIFYENL